MATFLPKGKRIEVSIHGYSLNRKTKRQTLRLRFDLTAGDDTLTGLPTWIQNAFTHIVQTGNLAKDQGFTAVFVGATMECFASAKGKTRSFLVVGADLSKFEMRRKGGSDEDVVIELEFIAEFAAQEAIHKWVYDTPQEDEVWLAFELAQTDLNLNGVQEKKEGGEEEDEIDAQQRRKEEAGARTTPLIPVVARRTPASSPHN